MARGCKGCGNKYMGLNSKGYCYWCVMDEQYREDDRIARKKLKNL